MNVGLFFDHYFNVLSGKTDTHKVFDFGHRPQNENHEKSLFLGLQSSYAYRSISPRFSLFEC